MSNEPSLIPILLIMAIVWELNISYVMRRDNLTIAQVYKQTWGYLMGEEEDDSHL